MKLGYAELHCTIIGIFVSSHATQTNMDKKILKGEITFGAGFSRLVEYDIDSGSRELTDFRQSLFGPFNNSSS